MAIAVDWHYCLLPALRLLLSSRDPYSAPFYNPPWLLGILIPAATWPEDLGRILLLIPAMGAFGLAGWRLGGKPLAVGAFIMSPLVFDALNVGNVEWIAVLGMTLPGPVGLVLALTKPQMTMAVVAFRLIETYRDQGWRGTARLLAFPCIVVVSSFVMFGPWYRNALAYRATPDLSAFPWMVPIGTLLFVQALRTRRISYAIAASPMFFPSVTPQVWLVVLLALVSNTPASIAASFLHWLVLFTRSA